METWEGIIHDAIKRYVKEECQGGLQEAADKLGIGYETFKTWYYGKKSPTLKFLSPCMEKLGFPLPGTSHMRRPGSNAPIEKVEGDGLVPIPVLGETGAGSEVELFDIEPARWLPVLPQYAKPGVIGMVVSGDSMEPTIRKGAVVGIIPFDGTLNEGGIYLIQRPPWGRMLKRVKIGQDGQIVLHSDNDKYEPFPVPYEGYEKIIVGRVVWIWQES